MRALAGIWADAEFDVAYWHASWECKAEKRGDQIRIRIAATRDRLSVIAGVVGNGSALDETSRRNLLAEDSHFIIERRDLPEEQRFLVPR